MLEPFWKRRSKAEPKPDLPVRIDVSIAQLVGLFPKESPPGAAATAKELFGKGDDKESDRIRLTVEGGKTLKLRLGFKLQIIRFFEQVAKSE